MPPVIGVAIAQALVAAGVTAGAAALVGAGITAVLSVAMSFAISSLTPKPTFNRAGIADLSQDAHPRTVMVRSSIEPHRIVYGRALVSGPLLFSGASGENNKYLHLIIALAGHEVYAIDTVYLNDDESTDSRIAALVRITKHLGADDQEVDADWIADCPDLVETTDRLRGIAYLYVRLEWDSQVWLSGVPNIRAVVRGRKIYDVRDGLTRWSTNAALCQRDYLTAGFGLGASTDDLDEVFWLAAANICA